MAIPFQLEPRIKHGRGFSLAVTGFSLLTGIILIGFMFLLAGANPFYALERIFSGSFGSLYGISWTITKAIPLMLIAAGLTLPFAGRFWNIGAEGQILIGALVGTAAGLTILKDLPAPVAVSSMFVFGAAGGALWGMIPAVLKIRLGVSEVISTLMLNYIAQELLNGLLIGPLRGKNQMGNPYSDSLPASFDLPTIPGTYIHIPTLILGVLACVLLFIVLRHSKLGYEIRVIGENREAARYAGIAFLPVTIIMMAVSGALAGMAGVGEVGGIHHRLANSQIISAGFGFTAIIVAWLARLNPLGIMISALFLAGILVGGDAVQISLKLPAATVSVMNGILLLSLISGEFFLQYRIVRTRTVAATGSRS